MSQRRVLWGFEEGEIRFPPSYRWRRQAFSSSSASILQKETSLALTKRESDHSVLPPVLDDKERSLERKGCSRSSERKGLEDEEEYESLGGDFTDFSQLVSSAYTTVVYDHTASSHQRTASLTQPPLKLQSASTSVLPPSSHSPLMQSRSLSTFHSSPSRRLTLEHQHHSVIGKYLPPYLPTYLTTFLGNGHETSYTAAGKGGEGKGAGGSLRNPSYTDRILTHSLPGKASNLKWLLYEMADEVGCR